MRLFHHDGNLYTEKGEEVEGLMGVEVVNVPGPKRGVASVRFTVLAEDLPAMPESVESAVSGLESLRLELAGSELHSDA